MPRAKQLSVFQSSRLLQHLINSWQMIQDRKMCQDDYLTKAERDLNFEITLPQLRRIVDAARNEGAIGQWPQPRAANLVLARRVARTNTAAVATLVDTIHYLFEQLGTTPPPSFTELHDRYNAARP